MIKKIVAMLLALFTAAVAFAAADANTASQAELDAIKGIGPSLSARIVDARKTGPFKDWNDLVTRVKGVGDKNSAEFSAAGLTVNGSAKSGAPADPSAMRKADKPTTARTAPAGTSTAPATPTAPVGSTSPTTTPSGRSAAATGTTAAATTAVAAASAPMSAADKKAARKAAKEEKARLKAANSAAGATSASSTPAHK